MIVAQLSSDTRAEACGLTVQSGSPVLSLCRQLIEAGHPSSARLEAYRGNTLCLAIRSIGEASGIRVATNGVGFIRVSGLPLAPYMSPPAQAGTPHKPPTRPNAPTSPPVTPLAVRPSSVSAIEFSSAA